MYWMKRQIILVLVLTSLFVMPAAAKEVYEAWHARDLFFYDEAGLAKRLLIAPKIAVEFDQSLSLEAQNSLLAKLPMTSQSRDPKNKFLIFAQFPSDTTTEDLLGFVNQLSAKKGVKAAPVFIVDNIEAVIEGFVVEPKITISHQALQERIGRFGEIDFREILPHGAKMAVFINKVKPPLNVLKLVNLVHNDPWVKQAYPRFLFLHDPIIAELYIDPISGTVGELRKAKLVIRMFDPAITLDEARLPNFGEGIFMPLIGDQPHATQPAEYFFKVLADSENRIRHKEERRDDRSRIMIYTWLFKMHDLGNQNGAWTIPEQIISYQKNGAPGEVKSNPVKMIVTPLVGDLKIDDMPPPRILPLPQKKLEIAPEVALPAAPSYWYERWGVNPLTASWYNYRLSAGFGAFALVIFAFLIAPAVRRRAVARRKLERFLIELDIMCKEAVTELSYQKLSLALFRVLSAAFPGKLPPHPTLKLIEDDTEVQRALDPVRESVRALFAGLEERHKPGFAPNLESAQQLADEMRRVIQYLRDRITLSSGDRP